NWKYWYPNGLLKAKGNYVSKKRHIETNCEGGDSIITGKVKLENWIIKDINGNQMNVEGDDIGI
ncbi:MAG: hypothetical protein AAF696_35135, partial [Bacteroidota bacterium]